MEETRRLYRSRTDRRISGICGGLAAYFKIDPTLVRLLFVLGLLLVGGTFWAYIVMMIVIPEEPL
jgi:phage shock protein PspC (stress-responsive transcriptional regulator)